MKCNLIWQLRLKIKVVLPFVLDISVYIRYQVASKEFRLLVKKISNKILCNLESEVSKPLLTVAHGFQVQQELRFEAKLFLPFGILHFLGLSKTNESLFCHRKLKVLIFFFILLIAFELYLHLVYFRGLKLFRSFSVDFNQQIIINLDIEMSLLSKMLLRTFMVLIVIQVQFYICELEKY